MTHTSFKAKKIFRNGCSLVLPKSVDISSWQIQQVMIIRETPLPQFSVAMKVEEVTQGVTEEGMIYMDQRNSGPIENDDKVLVIPVTPPKAEYVHLYFPESSRMPAGDWSQVIRESVTGNLYDWGENLRFIVPSQLSAPYPVEGLVQDSLPKPPVIIGEGTKITLTKHDDQTIQQARSAGYSHKQTRAITYIEQLKDNVFDVLAKLKADLLDSYNRVYKFDADPKTVHEGAKMFFKGYRIISEDVKESDSSFTGSFVAAGNYVDDSPTLLIETHTSGKSHEGKVQVWSYSQEEGQASRVILKDIGPKIDILVEGIKEETEAVTLECTTCGYHLDWKTADENGWIMCEACDFSSQLPLKYRTK